MQNQFTKRHYGNSKGSRSLASNSMTLDDNEMRLKQRAEKFGTSSNTSYNTKDNIKNVTKDGVIVGTCTELYKEYMRLTAAPKSNLIRPLIILQSAFKFFINEYEEGIINYEQLLSQLRSIRQDLKIQMVQDDFTLTVYKTNVNISIDNGDFEEFNQCINQVCNLIQDKDGYFILDDCDNNNNNNDFIEYKLIWMIFVNEISKIEEFRKNMNLNSNETRYNVLFEIFDFRNQDNYHLLHQSISKIENKRCKKIIDHFLDKERVKIISILIKSYNLLSMSLLNEELGFNDNEDYENLIKFLKQSKYEGYIAEKILKNGNTFKYLDSRKIRMVPSK